MRGRDLTIDDVTIPSQHTFADDEWHAHGGPGPKTDYIPHARAEFQKSQQQLRAAGFITAASKSFTLGLTIHPSGKTEDFKVGLTTDDGTTVPSLHKYTKFRSLGLFTSGLNDHKLQVNETMSKLLTATQVAMSLNISNARRREALRDLVPGTVDFPLGWTTISEDEADTMDKFYRECFRATLNVKRTDIPNAVLYAPRGKCGGFGLPRFKDRAHLRLATVFLWGLTSHDRSTQVAIHSHLRLTNTAQKEATRDSLPPPNNYQPQRKIPRRSQTCPANTSLAQPHLTRMSRTPNHTTSSNE